MEEKKEQRDNKREREREVEGKIGFTSFFDFVSFSTSETKYLAQERENERKVLRYKFKLLHAIRVCMSNLCHVNL